MNTFRVWAATFLLRAYVTVSLVVAAVFSPAALSAAPVLLLVWHLYLWWRPLNPAVRLLTDFFLYFAIALSVTTKLGPLMSLLLALPLLALVTLDLQEAAVRPASLGSRHRRSPTRMGVALPTMTVAALGLSWLLSSPTLLFTAAVATTCFVVLFAVVWRGVPLKTVKETRVQLRIIAGSQSELDVRLTNKTTGGIMVLESPYPWVRISPTTVRLTEKTPVVRITVTPPLSGPSLIRIVGRATDRWGLTQVAFEVEPVRLHVVPRARYAAWLANKYLAKTKPGSLPLVSNVARLNPMYGLRRGVEYYGSRQYQPGDSMKNIDWKHTAVHREIIVKEFAEFHGESAVVLANLAVGSPEEADQIAYKIIVTALTLAAESIPAALAAYDHKGVRLVTALLEPRQLVLRSLHLAMETVAVANPERHLSPADVARLRANISRTRSGKSEASRVLGQLLLIEYRNLDADARRHPVTSALRTALAKVQGHCSIVVISQRNHDAEALSFNSYIYGGKGHAVINV